MTLKIGVMLKIQFCHHRNKLHEKMLKIENSLLHFNNININTVFGDFQKH